MKIKCVTSFFLVIFFSGICLANDSICEEEILSSFEQGFPYLEYKKKILSSEFKKQLKEFISVQLDSEIEHLIFGDITSHISDPGTHYLSNTSIGLTQYSPSRDIWLGNDTYLKPTKLQLSGYQNEVHSLHVDLQRVDIFCENQRLISFRTAVHVKIVSHFSKSVAEENGEKYLNTQLRYIWDVQNNRLYDSITSEPIISCKTKNYSEIYIYRSKKNSSEYLVKIVDVPYLHKGEIIDPIYGINYLTSDCYLKKANLLSCGSQSNDPIKFSFEILGLDIGAPDFISINGSLVNGVGQEAKIIEDYKIRCSGT